MATDKGHHMDIIGKKELGWIVPEVLRQQHQGGQGLAGQQDRHRHHLVGDPDGTPYTLSAARATTASTTARPTPPRCPVAS
jgi:hypothetical protein